MFMSNFAIADNAPRGAQARAEISTLPPRPQSVCQLCWEGPFSFQLGLPCQVPHQKGKFSMPPANWGTSYSYSMPFTELESRAVTGCMWCRLLLAVQMLKTSTAAEEPLVVQIAVKTWVINYRSVAPANIQKIEVILEDEPLPSFVGLVYTFPDDPAAPYVTMKSPIRDVASPQTMALAKECIEECAHEHEGCGALSPAIPDPILPTRLIDCIDPIHPRLAVTKTDQRGTYLALSYMWGEPQPHSTTQSNVSTYEHGIDFSLLPPTIRDAIYVTHALGFRFLWVDTLCIIQDDEEDKRHEIGNMRHVYNSAHVTIVAASAGKVSDGFLHPRPYPSSSAALDPLHSDFRASGDIVLPFVCPQDPPLLDASGELEDRVSASVIPPAAQVGSIRIIPESPRGPPPPSLQDSPKLGPIDSRGWCMQEYLLSPRSLIFTSRSIQFRCQTRSRSVGDALCNIGQRKTDLIPSILFLADPPTLSQGWDGDWLEVHKAWLGIVRDYSGRTISLPSDKLPACAAIAEHFHRAIRSDYLAGLWRDRLLPGLLWWSSHGEGLRRPTPFRAPSWSWAAVDGELDYDITRSVLCMYPGPSSEKALADVVRCDIVLEDAALPFGRVADGSLVLRGSLLGCRVGAELKQASKYWPSESIRQILLQSHRQARQQTGDKVEVDTQLFGEAVLDCKADAENKTLWAVPLLYDYIMTGSVNRSHGDHSDAASKTQGILVALADSTTASDLPSVGKRVLRYRRVGFFCVPFMAPKAYDDWHNDPALKLKQALRDGEYPSEEIELV